MTKRAWLTIDDSPSPETDRLTDLLMKEQMPALLFARGDRLADDNTSIVSAIQKGFVIGGHAFSHGRASTLGFPAMVDEIIRTDALVDTAYRAASKTRPGKYFRFPHMDRGAGGWVVDYDAVPEHRQTLIDLFAGGLNIDLTPPPEVLRDLKNRLQDWLRMEGFTAPPCRIDFPWFRETEMAHAIDAMFTFSTSDWMITPRHAGKWPWKTPNDLLTKIDTDPWLNSEASANIVLMHDQDDMLAITEPLLRHMKKTIAFQAF